MNLIRSYENLSAWEADMNELAKRNFVLHSWRTQELMLNRQAQMVVIAVYTSIEPPKQAEPMRSR